VTDASLVVGIDPGFSGAIALIEGTQIDVYDMPTYKDAKGRTELNLPELLRFLVPPDGPPPLAVLERVSAMPGQGLSSTFRFGQQFGALQTALAGHGYRVIEPTPAQWKRHFGLSSKKDVSRRLASQHFPQLTHLLARKKDDGRAEALLLAEYGRQTTKC
jgi:crossover junction endodeoxyribonuclease RuvC